MPGGGLKMAAKKTSPLNFWTAAPRLGHVWRRLLGWHVWVCGRRCPDGHRKPAWRERANHSWWVSSRLAVSIFCLNELDENDDDERGSIQPWYTSDFSLLMMPLDLVTARQNTLYEHWPRTSGFQGLREGVWGSDFFPPNTRLAEH